MQSRLPTILGKAIEDATRTLNTQSTEERVVDLVQAIGRMGDLMIDLSGNAKLRPIIDDDEADVALWNKEIAKYFQGDLFSNSVRDRICNDDLYPEGKDFMNAPWLFAEAYKYRRLHECFSVSKFWSDYDVFYRQKVGAYIHVFFLIHLFLDSATRFLVRKMLSLSYPYVSPTHSKYRKSFRPPRNLKQSA